MNGAMLYRTNQRWLVWLGFAGAVVIHAAALAFSSSGNPPTTIIPDGPASLVEATIDHSDDSPPPLDIAAPDPPVLSEVLNEFHDEVTTQVRVARPITRVVRVTKQVAVFGAIKSLAAFSPRPEYPYEARRRGAVGSGAAALTIDEASGNVIDASMLQTTGNPLLDGSTLSALRRWRFKPGTPRKVQVPITFTLTGATY